MKRLFIIYLLTIVCFLSCKHDLENDSNRTAKELLQVLKDSTHIFSNITDLEISGEIKGDITTIKYYSISTDEFLSALENNIEQISYFSRSKKINEGIGYNSYSRHDSVLSIITGKGQIEYVDLKESENNRARNFFFQSKTGDYYVVKKIQFEDGVTYFLNSKSGNVDLDILTINVFTNDSLVFICSDSRIYSMAGEANISLLNAKNNKLDTILLSNTDWYTSFAFFDSKKPSMYYIHEKYKEDSLVSTYARMDIIQKMKNN